jgi:hypothetical protein
MKNNDMLKFASLLSLLLLVAHLADDVIRGMFPTGILILYYAIFSGLLLYGILVLAERRSGVLIMLLVSLFAIAMPVLHTRGNGVATIAKSLGGFYFVFTIMVLGALGIFSFILSLRALWNLRPGQARS